MMKRLICVLSSCLLAVCLVCSLSACGGDSSPNDGDNSDGGVGDNAFIGMWALYLDGSVSWYIRFNTDGTWVISDNPDGTQQRVYGTYIVDGKTAAGPMYNPGTGEGEIIATLDDSNTMALDFVEYWHSPYKHVYYTGTKI